MTGNISEVHFFHNACKILGRVIKNQQWIFGAIERGSRKVFLKCVQNRNSETLLELIREVIQPGTTIVSDLWRAYAAGMCN